MLLLDLNTMPWPHCLLHLRNFVMGFKDDNIKWLNTVWVLPKNKQLVKNIKACRISDFIIKYLDFAFRCNFPKMSIVGEGDMVCGMPVKAKGRMGSTWQCR